MLQRFEPMTDMVLAARVDAGKTPGGLIIPETAESVDRFLEITAVAKDETRVKVGDHFMVANGARCFPVTVNGQQQFVLRFSDIIGVMHYNAQELDS